ncbi:MAG: YrzE family protein [Anaerolineae bacterium]|nr:YrzE family protein [Anaerolineae bacterium]
MRIVANERTIRRGALIGRYASIAGLLVMLVALILSLFWMSESPLIPPGMWLALLVGVLLSLIGGYYAERFEGPRAHYRSVREALKGLDHRYTLYQHVLPASHVLLGPDGLTIIVVRSIPGRVIYENGRWKWQQRWKFLRLLVGEGLGVPEAEVAHELRRMARYLGKILPEVSVPMRGVVLFTHPDVRLDVKDPPVPVLLARKLKDWLRGPGAARAMPAAARRQLEEALPGGEGL